ncbi:hypothetical protein ACI76Y_10695 [Capnocytophaga cynodegmi]|uniref:hypothetical protein n=1 Tax=Capnocytophaga cynodegmi TaxID=28189 RepID=UPI00385908D8
MKNRLLLFRNQLLQVRNYLLHIRKQMTNIVFIKPNNRNLFPKAKKEYFNIRKIIPKIENL